MPLKHIIFSLIALSQMPPVADCFPKALSNLAPPAIYQFPHALSMEISGETEAAKIHTLQGINHLHAGWEFEAMRHFSQAMREDPRCLMAHWGMLMTMLLPSAETKEASMATANRLLTLVTEGEGNEQEKAYAFGLMEFLKNGAQSSGEAYQSLAKKFPDDHQMEMLAVLFSRNGYDEQGKARPNQEIAERILMERIEKSPKAPAPLNALLNIRAEAFQLHDTLALAQRLCQLAPDYPPYFYVLGHYEWRCGNHGKAASAFGRAASLYASWMREHSISPADCPGWVSAECYRVVSLASKGDSENALASAMKIASTKMDESRPFAAGTRSLLWDAKTLPARVLLRSKKPGASAQALASLPKPEESQPFREASLSHWWVDGLRIALEAQRLIDSKELKNAGETIQALSFHGQSLSKQQAKASMAGEINEWRRAVRALEILTTELNGNLVLAGPRSKHGSAFNWYRAAADRQKPQGMEKSPMILSPMALHLGNYFITQNDTKNAIDAFEEALKAFPNDHETMLRMEQARKLNAE
jgi:tetratricopeptide (TPR) repeat protein